MIVEQRGHSLHRRSCAFNTMSWAALELGERLSFLLKFLSWLAMTSHLPESDDRPASAGCLPVLFRGVATGLLMAVIVLVVRALGVDIDTQGRGGYATVLQELDLTLPDLGYAKETRHSHVLLPDGRLSIKFFDKQQHAKDLNTIIELFPEDGERQIVLDWGRQLVDSCRAGIQARQWRGEVHESDQQRISGLLSAEVNDELAAHAALRRLTCGPGTSFDDLRRLDAVVSQAARTSDRLHDLKKWASFRRIQRVHRVTYLVNGESKTLVIRPQVPDLPWFDNWMIYEDWGITDQVFQARKDDFLQRCGATPETEAKKWQAVQKLGQEWYDERKQNGDDALPVFDERAALIAVIDRCSGLDPVFSPKYSKVAQQHLAPLDKYGIDVSRVDVASLNAQFILWFLFTPREFATSGVPTLESNVHTPYAIEDAYEGEQFDAGPRYEAEGMGYCGQFFSIVIFQIPVCWIMMIAVQFCTVDLPGRAMGLSNNSDYARHANMFDNYGLYQLVFWCVLAVAGFWLTSVIERDTPVMTLLAPDAATNFATFIYLTVLSSALTLAIDNLVIVAFLFAGKNPFAKGMLLDNFIAMGLAIVLQLIAGSPFLPAVIGCLLGTMTPLTLEKLGLLSASRPTESSRKSFITPARILGGYGIVLFTGFVLALHYFGQPQAAETVDASWQPAEVQPHWFDEL